MKKIISHLQDYFTSLNKWVFLFSTLFAAVLVFVNYRYGLNRGIYRLDYPWQFAGWYLVFFAAFTSGYLLQVIFLKSQIFSNKKFVALLLIAPAIFAWKMVAQVDFHFATDFFRDAYWDAVVYWPYKVLMIMCMLYLVHRVFDKGQPFYGLSLNGFTLRPYLWMLLIMVPLIMAASTQKDGRK